MCVVSKVKDNHFMQWYTFSVWILGLLVLVYWCFELIVIQNVFGICSTKKRRNKFGIETSSSLCCSSCCCYQCKCKLKFPAAFIMISLSLLSSFLSSTLFLYSTFKASSSSNTCYYAPIPAIILRFLSKHFIWSFNIVRGQMVIEMLENQYLNKFVKYSKYILSTQMIVIILIILIFSKTNYDPTMQQCQTEIPLLLIISIIFIGESAYGMGFVYIFFKAMTTSMKRVIKALRSELAVFSCFHLFSVTHSHSKLNNIQI